MTDSVESIALNLERDIAFLFHSYATDRDGLDPYESADIFQLPYWEYLDLKGVAPGRNAFIRQGCLLLIVRMSLDSLWNAESPLTARLSACREAVAALEPRQDRERELCQLVLQVLYDVTQGRNITEGVFDQLKLVEDEILLDYFKGMTRRIRNAAVAEAVGEVSISRYEAQADEAYRRMYDAMTGTEAAACYNESKESLAEAIALARAMELPEETGSLEQKLERYRTVFRSQFRQA